MADEINAVFESVEEASVSDESQGGMNLGSDDDGEPIGDETMAKSMDMTMVSPSAIDNWRPEAQVEAPQPARRSRSRSVHFSSPLVTKLRGQSQAGICITLAEKAADRHIGIIAKSAV